MVSSIVEFCMLECLKQEDVTIDSVSSMVDAYWYARMYQKNFNIDFILELGKRVKSQNKSGFRTTPVVFSNGDSGIHFSRIGRAIENLLDVFWEISPEEFYFEFEKIHPFEDGNGRVGAILYNVMGNHDMENPIVPPNVF